MKFNSLLFILIPFIAISCSTQRIQNNEDVYISNGVERFFMPKRADWIRFSEIAGCRQPENQYFDFSQLKASYQFDYQKSVFIQNLYNEYLSQRLGDDPDKVDENKTFYEAYQQVESGANPFARIVSKKVYVIVIDGYRNNVKKLSQYFESLLPKGQVVFLSRCFDSLSLKKWSKMNGIKSLAGVIGLEYFSIFNTQNQRKNHWRVNLDKILSKKKIYLITQKSIEANYIYGYTKKWVY